MNSIFSMKLLVLAYIVIMALCLIEKKYLLAMYWFGAIVLNVSIILMSLQKG